jgi:VWFA-related protein
MKKGLFLFLFLFSFLLIGNVFAQSAAYQVAVDSIQNNHFPRLDAFVSVLDVQGFPIAGLDASNFAITEDGLPAADFQVTPYTNIEETLAVVLVIDTSGSMKSSRKPSPLDNSVSAAQNFLLQLGAQDLAGLISFADIVTVHSELTLDKAGLSASLAGLEAVGSTAMNDAIVAAIDMLKNRAERRAIILLTDGKPEGNQVFTYDQALAHASNYKVPIYPIGFGSVDKNQLTRLAEVTGGSVQVQPDSNLLSEAFEAILSIFREKYLFQVNSGIVPDNLEHDLEITVKYQGGEEKAFGVFIARDPVIVTVTEPKEGASLSGTVKVNTEVDSLNQLDRVEIFEDDMLLATLATPPFIYDWDTSKLVTGNHELVVKAYDTEGFNNTKTVNVIVELQRQDWIFWLIGLVMLVAAALFVSLGLRRKKAVVPKGARKAQLIETAGLAPGASWPLDKLSTKLGRTAGKNDIPLSGISASREHAVIERTQSGYVISTLNPENPLVINQLKTQQHTLIHGDVIELGESQFRFEMIG